MFKKILKGEEDYDNISRKLYGTPDKAGNLSKINNNTDGYIMAPMDEDLPAEGEGVRCNIDGIVYHRFYYYLLLNMLGAVKGVIFDFDSMICWIKNTPVSQLLLSDCFPEANHWCPA